MPEKFQKKYRIPSARLQDWDYGSDGIYFVTICTQKRECYFGDVVNGKMELSEIGEIVKTEWDKSFQIRAELFCDISVIMPNHIHAILIINNNDFDDAHGVETHGRASLRP
ncbi:MAG: hypothetical protein HQ522_15070, partial [Bacteroidetes bacterium]|nr:hypothetical protein [Bacteroidota bacterium]